MSGAPTKLGIIAGAGDMPLQIVRACEAAARQFHVIAVDEFADAFAPAIPHIRIPISKVGASIAALKRNGCTDVVFAGKLERPNGRSVKLRPDWGGIKFLVRLLGVLGRNDDSFHRAISEMFAGQGLRVVSPLEVAPQLAAKLGCLTDTLPGAAAQAGFGDALRFAKEHGTTKRGQAVIVQNGKVVACEERAGTDAMLAALDPTEARGAILVKAMAPTQLPTIDPPAIGLGTVENAARAGLAGILIEAGRSVILDEAKVRARADALGLFVFAATVGAQ